MRAWFIFLSFSLAAQASAQEAPSSLPSSQPTSPATSLPLDEAAHLPLSKNSEPPLTLASEPNLHFPYIEPPKAPTPILYRSSPGTAGALAIIPGMGHVYLGNYGTGAAYLGSDLAFLFLTNLAVSSNLSGLVPGSLFQNLWFYNVFDAYRDARVKRGDVGYKFPISREPLAKLASAPFRPEVLKRPWVWAGVPTALIGGFGVSLLAEQVFPAAKMSPMSLRPTPLLRSRFSAVIDGQDVLNVTVGSGRFAATFVAVGVGEESLFRGAIQSGLTQQFGAVPGWLLASALFGAAHISNFVERDPLTGARTGFNEAGYFAVPYITLIGAGLGYMYMKEDYKLEAGVAAHFWYDFLLSVGSLFALANDGSASFQFSFPL